MSRGRLGKAANAQATIMYFRSLADGRANLHIQDLYNAVRRLEGDFL